MRFRSLSVPVALFLSLLVHAAGFGVLVPLMAAAHARRLAANDAAQQAAQEALRDSTLLAAPGAETITLGIDDGAESGLVWIGHPEYQEQFARQSETEQAAFESEPVGGAAGADPDAEEFTTSPGAPALETSGPEEQPATPEVPPASDPPIREPKDVESGPPPQPPQPPQPQAAGEPASAQPTQPPVQPTSETRPPLQATPVPSPVAPVPQPAPSATSAVPPASTSPPGPPPTTAESQAANANDSTSRPPPPDPDQDQDRSEDQTDPARPPAPSNSAAAEALSPPAEPILEPPAPVQPPPETPTETRPEQAAVPLPEPAPEPPPEPTFDEFSTVIESVLPTHQLLERRSPSVVNVAPVEQEPTVSPASPPTAPAPPSEPITPDAASPPTPPESTSAPVPPSAPPTSPAAPSAASKPSAPSAAPPGPPRNRPADGDQSDRESDATSLLDVPPDQWRRGKPLATRGLDIKTKRPVFPELTRLTAKPGSPIIEIFFDRTGVPKRAAILRSSGDSRIDGPLVDSLYRWRASGEPLTRLRDGETIRIEMRILLGD